MTQTNDPRRSAEVEGHAEKIFTIALWKLQKSTPVMVTHKDIQDFIAAFGIAEGKEPKLLMHSREEGIMLRVMGNDEAEKFLDEYAKAHNSEIVDVRSARGG